MNKSLYDSEEDKLMFKLYNINSEIFKKYEKVSTEDILNELKQVTNPNYQNNDGNTYLHIACMMNNVEAVKILLDLGADPNIVNKRGCQPIISTLGNKNKNSATILELMFLHGLNVDLPMRDKSLKEDIESFGNNEYNEIIKKYYKK